MRYLNVELYVLAAVEAKHLHLGQLLQDPGPVPQFCLKGLGHEIVFKTFDTNSSTEA
jgi:hypothetical protein